MSARDVRIECKLSDIKKGTKPYFACYFDLLLDAKVKSQIMFKGE